MNNIEQMLANAQQTATTETQAQPQQQAAGQDYQQQPAQQQPAQQQNYEQQPTQQQPTQQQPAQQQPTQQQPTQQQPTQQQPTQQQPTQQQPAQQQPVHESVTTYQQPAQQPQGQTYQQPQGQTYHQPAQQPQAQTGQVIPMNQQAQVGASTMPANIPDNLPPELRAAIGQRVMTMETMASSDLMVGDWLKTSFYGMTLGSRPSNTLNPIKVEIDMTENSPTGFMLCHMVRWTVQTPQGEQTNYVHTYDGVMGSDGQPWQNAVMTAYYASANPQKPNMPYHCVQLPMTLLENIEGAEDPRDPNSRRIVLCEAGKLLGHTSAASGWKAWEAFHMEVKKAGLLGRRVVAIAENQAVQPQGSTYKWGVLKLTLVGESQGVQPQQPPQQQQPQQQQQGYVQQ